MRELQQLQHDAGIVASKTNLSVELEKIASDKGFIISDNEGSGNCMFYALSEQLNLVKGIQISHAELRQRLVQYLKDNPTLVSWCFYSDYPYHAISRLLGSFFFYKCRPAKTVESGAPKEQLIKTEECFFFFSLKFLSLGTRLGHKLEVDFPKVPWVAKTFPA